MKLFLKSACGILLCGKLFPEVIGIVGGGTDPSTQGGNIFLVDSSGTTSQVDDPVFGNSISITCVEMNNSGQSVISGFYTGGNFNHAALVSSSSDVTLFSNNAAIPSRRGLGCAINNLGNAVASGGDETGPAPPFLNTANSMGLVGGPGVFNCSCGSSGTGGLISDAMNDFDWVVAGGYVSYYDNPPNAGGLYIVQLAPGASTVDEVLCIPSGPSSIILDVGLNSDGQAIAGGYLNSSCYASLFNVSNPSSIVGVSFPFSGGQIRGVGINDSGEGIVGGQDNNSAAYAALVQPSGQLEQPLSGDPLPGPGSIINSVDITDGFGYAIIAGHDATSGAAYAAYVDVTGVVHRIEDLPTGASATISSVSMNQWGFALVGGTTDGTTAYAALINPFGSVTSLDITGPPVQSVSIRNFTPAVHLVRPHLTGNNLTFAKYILRFAPKKARYFSPSLFNGTLADALESAAPTRNALSIFAADNNLFYLNHGLSSHLRHRRQLWFHSYPTQMRSTASVQENNERKDDGVYKGVAERQQHCQDELFIEDWERYSFYEETPSWKDTLITSTETLLPFTGYVHKEQDHLDDSEEEEESPSSSERPYTLWGEMLGAWASQKAQHQTVGFEPTSAGLILAFEKTFHQKNQVGGGFSYLFTHIHEKEDQGFSNINQEILFLYGSWSIRRFYIDTALWGGLFQTDQERKIHMTGFDFKSTSNPGGGQFNPHLELGYALMKKRSESGTWGFMIDPFIMADWANAWQGSFQEKGNGPFNAGQKSHYSSFLRIEAGFYFYEAVWFDTWKLGLEQKGSYVYKNPFNVGTVNAFLVGSPGSFTVETLSSQENLGLVEVGMIFSPKNPQYPYGSISYQGEFGTAYRSQLLTLELSWDF